MLGIRWLFLLEATLLAGCMSSGSVGMYATSSDGWTIAYEDHNELYVAETEVRWVAQCGGPFRLSQDGRRLAWFNGYVPSKMHLLSVVGRREWSADIPDSVAGRKVEEVYFDPGGGVIIEFAEPATQASSRPNAPSTRAISVAFLAWTPDRGWAQASQPPVQWAAAPTGWSDWNYEKKHSPRAPIVEFGPDGFNARRTLWVRPDGEILELLRQRDLPVQWALYGWLFPAQATVYTAVSVAPLRDNDAAYKRLEQLVKDRRKPTPVQPPASAPLSGPRAAP